MRALSNLFVFLFFLALAPSLRADTDVYAYPYSDAVDATLTTALLKGVGKSISIQLPSPIRGRHEVPYLEGRDQLFINFHAAKADAPLILLQGGLGNTEIDGLPNYLADRLNDQGFNVAVFPSPFYWRYTLTASQSGLPGISSDDAQEIYGLMKSAVSILKSKYGLHPSAIGYLGYSMGGFEGARIEKLDRLRGEIGFSRYLLINVPVDLTHGMGALDAMAALVTQYGADHASALFDRMEQFALAKLAVFRDDADYFLHLNDGADMTSGERKLALGIYMHACLSDVIVTGQSIHDTGFLAGPANAANRSRRELQASRLSYADYFQKLVLPYFLSTHANGSLEDELSLKPYTAELEANPDVFLIQNENDILLTPDDLQYMKAHFKGQLQMYAYGGHCGNVWYPPVLKHIREVFAPLLRM